MACEKFKTTLGDNQYNYTQLPARKSLNLKLRIGKVFSQAIPDLLHGAGKSENVQLQMFAKAITITLAGSNANEITDLIFDIVSTVQIDDDPIDADTLFSGDLVMLYTLVYWVLKKEYGSFLAVMIGLLVSKSVKKRKGRGSKRASRT